MGNFEIETNKNMWNMQLNEFYCAEIVEIQQTFGPIEVGFLGQFSGLEQENIKMCLKLPFYI